MTAVVSVDPFRCRMWALHDRLDDYIDEASCRSEIESFAKHGQLLAALGRPLKGDAECDVELIYGSRRLFVARHLNKPLAVELREMSDRDALIAMDMENRQRQDISAYERGLSYARWLRLGVFASQEDIARTLKMSASQVSRLTKLASLPSVILSAFNTPADICEGWGLELVDAWNDTNRRALIAKRAREIAKDRSCRGNARNTYAQLLAAPAPGRQRRAAQRDEIVRGANGRPILRVRKQLKSVVLILPLDTVSTRRLALIKCAVTQILQDATSQHPDTSAKTSGIALQQ
jgi:ParB family transcriptional regulator, chromosome partitioning protein